MTGVEEDGVLVEEGSGMTEPSGTWWITVGPMRC